MKKKLNPWIEMSIEYANQRSYLDDLFHVYPTIPEGIRDIDGRLWKDVEKAFEKRDNVSLLESLLKLDLFPIKDSYVAYLRRDKGALNAIRPLLIALLVVYMKWGLRKYFLARLNRKKQIDKSVRFSNAGSIKNL